MANTTPAGSILTKGSGITGNAVYYPSVAVTADNTTTAKVAKTGYVMGVVENNSGSALTITWWGSLTEAGANYLLKDSIGDGITSTIDADDIIMELPPGIAAVPFLVPVGSGSATVSLHFTR